MKHTITRLIALILTLVIFAGGGRADQVTEEEEWIWPDAPKTQQEETPSAEDETEGAEMAKIETYFDCDLKKAVQVQPLNGNVFSLDNNGNRIGVRIFDNGVKTTVTGTVTGRAILADNSTVNLNGGLTTVNGQSVAYVDVPQGALLIPGTIKITIQLTASGVITTLAAILSTVYQTKTDNVITPSAQVIADWNAEISSAIQTQNATIASAIATQDAQISDLKSALDEIEDLVSVDTGSGTNNYRVSSENGSFIGATGYKMSDYTPVESGKMYVMNFIDLENSVVCIYNSSKSFIESVTQSNLVEIPSNGKFIIVSNYKAQMDDLVFSLLTAKDERLRSDAGFPEASIIKSMINAGYSSTQTILDNLNNAKDNVLYLIVNQNPAPSNVPSWISGSYYVITIKNDYSSSVHYKHQYIINASNLRTSAYREYLNGTWYSWSIPENPLIINYEKVGYSNVQSSISDLNDAVYGMLYFFSNPNPAPLHIPAGVPSEYYVITLKHEYGGSIHFAHQYILNANLTVYAAREYMNGTWYNWNVNKDYNRIVKVDINGHGDYTKLTDALADAYSIGNTTIYVEAGEYDIFDEVDITYNQGAGPIIGNNTTLIFASKAKVICDYSGSNGTFSALNAGTGDFKVVNMNLHCKNIRYCVHDELMGVTSRYTHEFIDCDMELDNSENQVWQSTQCIGGGLGENGYVVVDGGSYNSHAESGDIEGEISYHNTNGSGAKSKIVIKNVRFVTSTARFGYYGTSTDITECYVMNCLMKQAPILRPENSSAEVVNMELIAWGNVIAPTQDD